MTNNRKKIRGFRMISYGMFACFMLFPVIMFMAVSPSCSILTKRSCEKYMQSARKYSENKDHIKAYRNYTKAIETNKLYAKAYWERATVGALIDSSEKSIDDWGMFISFSKNTDSLSTAYYNRGNLMLKQGYKSDACDDWKKSSDLNGKSSNKSSEQYRLHCK